MKSDQMMVKVLNVLSYAREKYKNISIMNTLVAFKPERLKMFLVIHNTIKTLMTVSHSVACSGSFIPHINSITDFFFHLYYVLGCASFQSLLSIKSKPFHVLLMVFIWIFLIAVFIAQCFV